MMNKTTNDRGQSNARARSFDPVKLLRFSLFTMLLMLCGGSMWADDVVTQYTFEKVTSNEGLVIGEKYIIVCEGENVAMGAAISNNKSRDKVAVSIKNSVIISESTDIAHFTLGGETDAYTLSDGAQSFLALTKSSNEIHVATSATENTAKWKIDITKTTPIESVGFSGRYIKYNSSNGIFRCYASGQNDVTLYKLTKTEQVTPKTATTTTLSEGYTTSGMEGTTIDLPTANVMAGDNAVSGASVTWSSSDEEIATIGDGVINLLKPGTVTITASFEEDDNYLGSEVSFELTVTESPEIANPYTYTFEAKVFDAKEQTKKLSKVNWALKTDGNYFGYDGTKGQQFGSGSAPATTLTLSTSDIPGTITSIIINTSGASSIAATIGITVGGTAFKCDNETTASLTSTAANYTFIGSASGDIVISYNQTSSKAIYIKSIEIAYTEEATPNPLYILGDMANWDRTNPTAMAWDSENEVYTYTFTSTAAATYFCFADGTQTAEEAAADNEWTTFNSTYRWAIAEGDQEYNLNWLDTPEQLQKTNGTIILPAGEWTISVTADMIMTITGEATPVEEHTYIVAGGYEGELSVVNDFDPLLGTRWDGSNEDNMMTKQDDGSYKLELTNKILYKGTYEFKIVEGNDWVPANNIQQTISETGIYNAVFTFYPENAEESALALTKQEGSVAIVAAGGFGDEAGNLDNVLFTTTWHPSLEANKLTEQEDGTFTKVYEKVALPATTINYKIVVNGNDWVGDSEGANLTYGITEAGNYNVTVTYNPITRVAEMTAVAAEEPVVGFRDIKADLTQLQSLATNSAVLITVADDGTIGTTDDETKAAAKLKGGWHGTAYGWTNFTADVPVEGCVKITYATHDYGNDIIVTNEAGDQVAKFNTTGAKWSSSHDNVVVAYYRSNEPTTLHFSNANYNPYFAVEAIAEEDLPAEVTSYNVTFAAEDAEGVVPAAVEVEAGGKVTIPANYTLYKEGYTLTGWNDGTNDYAAGAEITPEADMTLYAVFTENTVSLDDRTEAVTVTFALDGSKAQYGFQGGTGIIVTQTTVNGETIDVKAATSGKFAYNGGGWHQMNNGSLVAVPSCKDATIVVNGYQTGYTINANNTAMTGNADNSYTYTATTDNAIIEIAATADNTYINNIVITLPAPEEEEIEGLLYSWESPNGTVKEKGGKAQSFNGTTETTGTDASDVNAINSTYYTLRLSGAKDFSSKFVTITLDKKLHKGDIISITGYRNKNDKNKKTGALIKFEKGSETVTTVKDGDTRGLEFVNIDTSDASAEDLNRGTEPNTIELTVPESADGSKTITMTRAETGTNLFITKLVITTEVEDDPNAVETPMITPATGTYGSEQEVTITCETEDAKIYYTTDGTDPTAESTAYTAAFTVSETTTVKAIAIKGEYSSEIAESVITITTVEPGTSNLEWDYTEAAPTENPDPDAKGNNLYYGAKSTAPTGVKLNSSGYAFFAKNPVEGKLTLTFGLKSGTGAYAVNVYACTINGGTATKGDLIDAISVDASPGTNSLDIPATVTGIYIERKSTSEGVLQKIVFKEKVARTFKDFEITNEELKGTYDPSGLPQGVEFSGTPHNDSHGYQNVTLTVPTDGGAVKFTIGGCQYANPATFDVKNSNSDVVATIDEKTSNCYHQTDKDISTRTVTYIYTGEATTLTFGPMAYLPYFKAEAVEVQEVTVTYKDQNGTILGEKKVIEGDAIGESPYSEADLTIADNEKFRGWTYTSGIKVKTTDVVTSNTTVLASVTPIEAEPTVGSVQTYDLTNNIFYPEDHENFDVTNGSYYNNHGFDFAAGGSFSVKVAGKAQIVLTLCEYGSGTTITVTDANSQTIASDVRAKAESTKDGDTETLNYDGEATTLTFTFATQTYLHKVTVYNVENFIEKDEATGWYIVPAGDGASLVLALNAAASEPNSKIFLPNGTYDLGQATMTPISGNNISVIGESMDGVVIKNRPIKEGLDVAATFLNTGTGLYMQDLTIDCIAPWSGTAERGVTLRDKGNQTILKNVYLKGLQDTYYSNNPGGTFYFEDGKVEGSVDYVCGNGDVYFNKTSFYTVNKSTGGKGGCIAAPNTTTTDKKFGYIFNKCTLDGVENEDGQYRLGRPWADNTQCLYLNTTMNIQPRTEGWGEWSDDVSKQHSVTRYAEYNSMDADGNAISLTGRKTSFKGVANNPVLTEDEAAAYTPEAIFNGDWRPQVIATQVTAPKAELKDGVITWTPANDGPTAYAIFKDGKFLGITTENSWTVEEAAGAPRRTGEESQPTGYTIRAANSRGGFGLAAEVSPATGISAIEAELGGDVKIYDLNGRRVMTPAKGVYIINGKKTVIK